MKTMKSILVTLLLAVSATASAQFTNTHKRSSSKTVKTTGWDYFYVQWNPSSFNFDIDDADNQSFTGFSVGYNRAFGIANKTPLFLEVGAALQYSHYTEDGKVLMYFYDEDYEDIEYDVVDGEEKFNMFSVKVPVNLLYKFDIPNSSVSLLPFVGATLRGNISAKKKVCVTDDDYDLDGIEDTEYDLFDKKDMGSKEKWKRFQIGWQIGVNAHFGESFLVGLSYGSDFSEICRKTKINTTSVTLGYRF